MKKTANQYGRYVWMPNEPVKTEPTYSARVYGKGCQVSARSDDKDELVKDLTELIARITPLGSGKAGTEE